MRGETRRHDSWCGLRWTLVDRKACGAIAYGQAAWSCPPDAGVKPRVKSPGRRRLTSPVLRGERGAAVTPLRRECRVISAYLCWPACVFCFARVAVGAACTRHSLRPLFRGSDGFDAKLGREIAPRECERSSLRGAQRRSNPCFSVRSAMDCFAEPVIGRAFARPVGSQ